MTLSDRIGSFRPCGEWVLVRKVRTSQDGLTKTAGGLLLIAEHVDKAADTFIGEVLKVGPGRFKQRSTDRHKPEVKVGDRVVYPCFAEQRQDFDFGDGVFLVKESDLLGIV